MTTLSHDKETEASAPSPLDELRHLIGTEVVSEPFVVDVRAVARFRDAIHPEWRRVDGRPLDAVAATTVPPMFFCPDPIICAQRIGLPRPRPYPLTLDGGSEWEFRRPIRIGDVLTLTARIADIFEKQGSLEIGRMILAIIEVEGRNQRGEVVGAARSTSISYEGLGRGADAG